MTEKANPPGVDDLFFKALIEGYVANPRFVRRDWLADEVAERLKGPECRFVLLTAAPGAGKSAFIAQLAADHPDWLRYFIRRDQRTPLGDVGVHSFLLRIGYQLAARFPELFTQEQLKIAIEQRVGTVEEQGEVIGAEVKKFLASPFYYKVLQIKQCIERNNGKVVGLRVEELVIDPRLIDPKDLQYMALIDPALALLKREPEKQVVVLVDALDEIRYHGSEGTLLKWLIDCPELPENVRFVLTSRPPEGEVITFREKKQAYIKLLTIESKNDRVHNEMRAYVEILVGIPEVNTILSTTAKGVEDFSKEAVQKADGNIGYLDALARGIDQALSVKKKKEAEGLSLLKGLLSLNELPKDTQELYGFFLHQIKNSPSVKDRSIRVRDESTGKDHFLSMWTEVYKPVLSVLAVAFEPLSIDQIHALGGIAGIRDNVIEATEWLRQFLDEEVGLYRFYHATMPEFLTNSLTGEQTETKDLYVDPHKWHLMIAHFYIASYSEKWPLCDSYGLKYLLNHSVNARLREQERGALLDKILTDRFIQAFQERFGWLYDLVDDLESVALVDPQRTSTMCMNLLLTSFPNSLVYQRLLRLLTQIRPKVGRIGNERSTHHKTVDAIVSALGKPRAMAVQLLDEQLQKVKNPRVRGIIALALGETGTQKVRDELLRILKSERRAGSWMAADALIALNDTAVIPHLIQWYHQTRSGADRERVLYILGWMRAEEARALLSDGLESGRYRNVGRALDLMWLLSPAKIDITYLQRKLQAILANDPLKPRGLGPWGNEWVQKRLVRTLQKRGMVEALPDLRRLQDHVVARGKPKDPIQRGKLVDAIKVAIRNLEGGQNGRT